MIFREQAYIIICVYGKLPVIHAQKGHEPVWDMFVLLVHYELF